MNKKDSPIILRVLLIAILGIFILGTIFTGLVGGSILEVMKKTPDVNPENIKYEMSENSYIVDREGNEIDYIKTSENREIVDFNQMPDHLKNAFIAVEDERFLKHNGIDPISIIGSAFENFKSGSIVRGGSTLTQQLARNTYLSNDQTYERKIKEIYIALEIEDVLDKDEILEAYMNRVFLGQNSYGVQAAANTYFSKDVSELTLAESATIAGIVQSPTEYALFKAIPTSELTNQNVLGEYTIDGQKYSAVYNEKPLERQEYVLAKMLEEGYISEPEYKDALSENVAENIKPPKDKAPIMASYFNTLMEKQVVEKLMDVLNIDENQAYEKLYYGGLRITTTVDQDMQNELEEIYDNFSQYLVGNTQGASTPPLLDISFDGWGNIVNSDGRLIYYSKNNVMSENNDYTIAGEEGYFDEDGNFIINSNKINLNQTNLIFKDYYTPDDENSNLRSHKAGFVKFSSNEDIKSLDDGSILISNSYLKDHDDFIIENEKGSYSFNKDYYDTDLEGVIQPQSSAVVIDHKNGEIKAIMGGRDQKGQKILNRAIDQPRQPGSSIKPIATYTPALDNGYNLATGIDDVPFMRNENGEIWPENVYKSYKGIVSLRDSIIHSVNTNAVRTLKDIGIDSSKRYLENFGIIKENGNDNFVEKDENSEHNDENLAAMGLGAMTNGLSVLDMTAAYATLANEGEYIEPLTFSKIEDRNKEVIFDSDDKKKNQVTSPETAYQMTSALYSTGQEYGTINLGETEYATKTGTSDEDIDFWCVGYSPYYTVGIWMGADNQNLSLNGYSYQRSARMWSIINERILQGYDIAKFEEPDGIIHAKVDTISGKIPTEASYADPRNVVKDEIFSKDNQPKEEDDIHVWALVDTRNNLLASNKTPNFLQANRSFIDRKGSYDPSKWDGILPEDWKYNIPNRYSDLGYQAPRRDYNSNRQRPRSNEEEKNKDNLEKEQRQNEEERQEKDQEENTQNNEPQERQPQETPQTNRPQG